MEKTIIEVTVVGNDRKGVVADITNFIFKIGGNIEQVNQNVVRGLFGMQLEASFETVDRKKIDLGMRSLAKKLGMEIKDFSFWAIIFPILFIFFLLGIICFLEPKVHYLVARIAITLGVFAFVFTFDTILPAVKPDYIKNISTFADFLLKLVFVAAIASTIGSVVGYRMAITIERQQADKNKRIVTIESKKDKWINRIQKYSLYDLVALVFVSVIILKETVITNLYSLEYP